MDEATRAKVEQAIGDMATRISTEVTNTEARPDEDLIRELSEAIVRLEGVAIG